jgi:hypothetical protein
MDLKTFDIILLFILAITVSLIIGFNVVYLVDKKIGDITINVPKPVCPTPNIVIKAFDGSFSKIPIKYVGEVSNNPNSNNSKNSNNSNNLNKPYVENFTSLEKNRDDGGNLISATIKSGTEREQLQLSTGYSDYSDSDYYGYVDDTDYSGSNFSNDSSIDASMSGYIGSSNSMGSATGPVNESTRIANKMMYPRDDNIIRYDGTGCYSGITNNTIKKKVDNKKNEPLCRSSVKTDKINNVKTGIISASGEVVLNNINFYVPKTYMGGDPFIRGSNFGAIDFEPQADIDQIGSIPVNDYHGNPVPIGSTFDDKY